MPGLHAGLDDIDGVEDADRERGGQAPVTARCGGEMPGGGADSVAGAALTRGGWICDINPVGMGRSVF